MAVEKAFLESIPYFTGLQTNELDVIRKLIFERTVPRGDVIVLEGASGKALYFVSSGAVKIFKTSVDGKEQILNIVRPGESFNDVSIFDGGLNPASAEAMGPVTVYGLRKQDLDAILRDHPRIAFNVIGVLVKRVRHLVSLVEDLSFRQVIGRVAKILLDYAGDGTESKQRLTQQEMAAMAGTAREVVGRSLKALEAEGVIRIDRHRVVITGQGALREMAGVSH